MIDNLCFIDILDRNKERQKLKDFLTKYETADRKDLIKRGVYIYGDPGVGKTYFAKKIMKEMNYDIVLFDTGNIRNKSAMNIITKNNMSNNNVISYFKKKKRKLVVIMDEIDGMNNGDKGGINYLIKMIRPKKTKKQRKEAMTLLPIICIGNYHLDKKIKELKKVCELIEIKPPTYSQMKSLIKLVMPNYENEFIDDTIKYIGGDLRKLFSTYNIYKKHENILKERIIQEIFQSKTINQGTKDITKQLFLENYGLEDHLKIMNETDRTSVSLLFHENVIDILDNLSKKEAIIIYEKILNNICFSDYIDRITFQKQIWCFNEMSSLIKTIYNHTILKKHIKVQKITNDIRFTKVLTKYSTEYNNMLFLKDLSKKLCFDKKDMLTFFIHMKHTMTNDSLYDYFQKNHYNISKLDINRIYRFIDFIYPVIIYGEKEDIQ